MPVIDGVGRMDPRWWGRFFLASARFVEKKNLPALLDAYAVYRDQCSSPADAWPLVLLGDGPLRPSLAERRRSLGLEDTVHMPGFVQYAQLPDYYAAAGAFVHASTTEQWGLVVNEAMASGMPVGVSRRCGCAEMLVADGVNGFIFDPYDTAAIADVLRQLAEHPDPASLGRASRARIALWGPERFGHGLAAAAEAACRRGPTTASVPTRLLIRAAAMVQHRRG
jgi:glycosyltransferase involved in cell wall biosynthesis